MRNLRYYYLLFAFFFDFRLQYFWRFQARFFFARASRVAKNTNAPRRSRRATIMSQQSNAIVAQPSSSARALKRSTTPRGREMAAKKARGIEKKLPWAVLDRRETRVASDEDGEHTKEVCVSRQRSLLKAGASTASREAARGNAFGGSRVVREAHESAARDVASGGGNQEITADGYDYMVKSFESWAMFALPDTHAEHLRVKAMDAALKRFDNKEEGFSLSLIHI